MLTISKTKDWVEKILTDKQFQQDEKFTLWRDNIRRFSTQTRGLHSNDHQHDSEFVNVNFVYAYIKTVVPAVYFRDPHIFITAQSSEEDAKANTIEAIIASARVNPQYLLA